MVLNIVHKVCSSLIMLILLQSVSGVLEANESHTAIANLFNKLGVVVHEACLPGQSNACWSQSVLYAFRHRSQAQSVRSPLLEEVVSNMAQPDEHHRMQWLPAHQLNAALVQIFKFFILTIELTEANYIHIVLTSPSEEGYEHTVLSYLPAQRMADPDSGVGEILQWSLQVADITLFLTPGHVQPVVSTEYQQTNEEPVFAREDNDRVLLSSFLQVKPNSAFSGQGGGAPVFKEDLRPDLNALYGASRHIKNGLPDDVKAKRKSAYQWHSTVSTFKNYITNALMATLVGVSIYHWNELIAVVEYILHQSLALYQSAYPYWVQAKAEVWALYQSVYPYWAPAKAEIWALWIRYYWQIDTSECSPDQGGVEILADEQGLYRTAGLINGQPVNLLVDTGANLVSMNIRTAEKLGINIDGTPEVICNIAFGQQAACRRVTLKTVQLGCLKLFNIQAVVSPDSKNENEVLLLGMSFTKRLNMSANNGIMTLKAK